MRCFDLIEKKRRWEEMNYIKQKRSQIDKCNICGNIEKLTWDHVPPKAILSEPNTFANTLYSGGQLPSSDFHMRHYQNGIKYRTVCSNCNNVILGRNDKAYKEFMEEVKQQIGDLANAKQLGIVLPRTITVKAKINRVLRAICGHFLSMKTIYDDQTLTDIHLREYVLNESLKLDSEQLFCWFYPYPTILNARDMNVQGHINHTHPKGFISVMASYPLGYMVSSEDESDCLVDNLGKYSTTGIDDIVPIVLHPETSFCAGTNKFKHFIWPLNISNDEDGVMFALGNQELMDGSRLGVTASKG